MIFSKGIKDVRERCLLSQEAFAQELGVAVTTVNRWEKGKATPNCKKMQEISKFCDNHKIKAEGLNKAWKESRNADAH